MAHILTTPKNWLLPGIFLLIASCASMHAQDAGVPSLANTANAATPVAGPDKQPDEQPDAQLGAQLHAQATIVPNDTSRQNALPATAAPALRTSPAAPPGRQQPGQVTPSSTPAPQSGDSSEGPNDQQSKRILWIIPNYRAVNAGTYLPPESAREKFKLATQDSFDYSSFILAGLLAGYGQATNSSPAFHQELSGYGRYYWHSFVDETVGNYFTEAIVPLVTHEDPRYYTLGHGQGALRRTVYAVSRLVITRTDSGAKSFNFSEILGNALAAGVSNAYYPAQERTVGNNADKWATQIGIDALSNLLKEFWPDIRRGFLRANP